MGTIYKNLLLSMALGLTFSAQADDALALKAQLAEIDSLKANFSQKVTDINGKVIQEGTGLFALQQPNQFYWHLLQPDESLIVADGIDVWVYNPFAEEVTVMGINDAILASPISLLVNQDQGTWSQYQVDKTETEGQQDNCFLIKPNLKQTQDTNPSLNEAPQTQVSVCFSGQSLTEFAIFDEQGNHSQFVLSNQAEVEAGQEKLFEFVLPEDVDVDDQRISPAS